MKHWIFLIVLFIFVACGGGDDPRLSKIKAIVSNYPEDALAALDSIDYGSLHERDRHLYDFLSIKAKDKTYIHHTSDSLILDVIKWYKSNPSYGLYPEALYYGGRVYSDLGDKPTALRYFQLSLDEAPENREQLKLRGKILSQTGRLLNTLRLYNEAISYLEETIKIDCELKDSLNEVYDLHLIGNTEIRSGKYDKAEQHFKEALPKAKKNIKLLAL